MRSLYLFHGLLGALLIVGCTKNEAVDTDGGSGTESSSGSGSGSATEPDPTANPSGASNSGAGSCVPGMSVACACPEGTMGAQVCAADGESFEPCVCQGNSGGNGDSTTSPTDPDPTNASADPSASSTSDATTSDGTGTGGSTTDDTGGGIVCDDPGPEPNEDEASADDHGNHACAAPAGNIAGVLNGETDSDWSRFHGVEGNMCGFQNPFVSLTLTASDAVRLCMFVDCDNGNPDFDCPMGTMPATSPGNLPGCCGSGDLSFQLNCAGTMNESADFFVRVDQAAPEACIDYTIAYTYGPMP